ncbi:MAG: hypothetical protein KJ550_11185 [Proteobacteria bacterium]|nr:hypothetical protein [Pseudomonadota bacterium]MBU4100618.1 hypothetical protein [Pseudomonadota bacterium]
MPLISELRDDIKKYIKKPSHPSLNTELLEPKHRLIYSFRIDRRYRALFICLPEDTTEILAVTKHYHK